MAYANAGKTKYTAADGNNYYAMQDITSDICDNVAIGTFEVPNTGTLVDKRDGKTYQVSKLKMTPDGTQATCWMTQNLALVLSTTKTLTSDDTDLNSVASWTPERNTLTSAGSSWPQDNVNPYSYNPNNASYGIYYNWPAAVASNNTSSMTTQYSNAPDSICPKGWRLPMVYNSSASDAPNELGNLLYSYGFISSPTATNWVSNGFQQSPLSIVLSGWVWTAGGTYGKVDGVGTNIMYWASTIRSSTNSFAPRSFTSGLNPTADHEKANGFAVRCVLR